MSRLSELTLREELYKYLIFALFPFLCLHIPLLYSYWHSITKRVLLPHFLDLQPRVEPSCLPIMAFGVGKVREVKVSQSVVGRANAEKTHGLIGMLQNPYVFMTCLFASLACMMYGYDQGVMGSILVMENFEAHFPSLTGSTIQGWLVSALELGAWFGALFCGWLADKISRKYSMLVAVVIFTLGTGLQTGAQNPGMLFAGRVVGGIGIGMFSMVCFLLQFFITFSNDANFQRSFPFTRPRLLHPSFEAPLSLFNSFPSLSELASRSGSTTGCTLSAVPTVTLLVLRTMLCCQTAHSTTMPHTAIPVSVRRQSLGASLLPFNSYQHGFSSLECSSFRSLLDGL